ncbi:MAG: Xaa-Pro peptidase family protein [Abditibacteriales bacterium]|nr:Xaa-Pro peptidase family protein [Abditibacteriales bacterium]MDW8367794.1 Xaa-Pro peptidase family protein [Abditibacteriales bacterium]
MNFSHRLAAVRQKLSRLKADAFLCSGLSNVRYLTGYTGSAGMALISADGAWFFTDFRYQTQAKEQVRGYDILIAKGGLSDKAAQVARKKKLKRVAFEAAHVTVAAHEAMAKQFKEGELVPSKNVVEELRVIKDEGEIAAIRKAVEIADKAFNYILGQLRPGRVEREVALEIEEYMIGQGADGLSFDAIVASGARSALPHGKASAKRLEWGDLITFDFGCKYQGYCSDLTRTVCLGKPTSEQQKIYRLVLDAQKRAEEAIRADAVCKAVDAAARDYIKAQGYKENFGHGLGHGVGIDIHEAPRLHWRERGKLKAGQVVTVEPGIYIEGWGGVRMEDMVVVTQNGAEILTRAPKPARIMAV